MTSVFAPPYEGQKNVGMIVAAIVSFGDSAKLLVRSYFV